jgi:hypothetical protein
MINDTFWLNSFVICTCCYIRDKISILNVRFQIIKKPDKLIKRIIKKIFQSAYIFQSQQTDQVWHFVEEYQYCCKTDQQAKSRNGH